MQTLNGVDLKILVVDDEVISRLTIKLLLEDLGYKVITAHNGSDALNKLNDQSINLILTDINMPIMDGIQFTKRLRSTRNGKQHIPVIAITSSLAVTELEQARSAGINNIYTKPIDPTLLKNILCDYAH